MDQNRLPTPAQQAAEVIRLSEAATPGPWYVLQYEHDDPGWLYVGASDAGDGCNVSFEPFPEDAEFIAYARTAAPSIAQALLDALERERALVEAVIDVPSHYTFAETPAALDAILAIVTAHDATAREDGTGE